EPAGPSLPHRDEAAMLERAQRLAHGHAAGPELAHELALGRKLVAMREPALVNRALDLRDDVLVYAGRPNCSEHRCASLSDQRASMSRARRGGLHARRGRPRRPLRRERPHPEKLSFPRGCVPFVTALTRVSRPRTRPTPPTAKTPAVAPGSPRAAGGPASRRPA